MKKIIFILLLSILTFGATPITDGGESEIQKVTDFRLDNSRRKSINSVVMIMSEDFEGHGSGSYLKYRGFHIVVTASHVAGMAVDGRMMVLGEDDERVLGHVVYEDHIRDFAFLLLEKPMESRTPIVMRLPAERLDEGAPVTYSGFPATLGPLSFEGYVAGHQNYGVSSFVVLHTFGWMGVSGSGVFDIQGRLVGIVVAIVKLQSPWSGFPPILAEDIILAVDTTYISTHELMKGICGKLGSDTGRCRVY